MKNHRQGLLFDEKLQKEVKSRFLNVEADPEYGERVFFENAGGSLRLKAANEAYAEADSFPDCDSRKHTRAKALKKKTLQGFVDIRMIFNAPKYGQIITETSSTKVMFTMVRTILENVNGSNCVVSELDHPCAYDSIKYYSRKRGMEFRVAQPNLISGGLDPETIVDLVDTNTALLNVIAASNHTGAVADLEKIVTLARAKKSDLFIIVDAVQHIPHGLIDVQKVPVDGVNFAGYKVFSPRGFGAGYISDRVAVMDHPCIYGNLGDPWELGGPAPAMFASISAVADYVCWLGTQFSNETERRKLFETGMHAIEMHERALMHHTLEGTQEIPGLRHISNVKVHFDRESLENRDFIMPITFDNINYTEAVASFQQRGVIVYDRNDTNYYSVRSLHPFGLDGFIRVSPLHCHDTQDVDKFLKATKEIAGL